MSKTIFEMVEESCTVLQLPFSSKEFAQLAEDHSLSEDASNAVGLVLEHIRQKKTANTIQALLRFSRLSLKHPKTFQNFDFSVLRGKNVEKIRNLQTLSALYAHKNIAFIGPAGTGKTHLAKAFGYECCNHGLRTYFIKMTELRDRFTTARRTGKVSSLLNSLVRPSCLIIDEVGHCEFDKENTRLFFDLIDRRYNKDGNYNIVFTSNKNPSEWRGIFNEDDALLCALDRIFDSATVITIKGSSFRGSNCETISVQTTKASAPVTAANSRGETN